MTEERPQEPTYGVRMRAGGEAIRWIDLSCEDIAQLAHHQLAGDFGAVSDATTALHLIEALAHRLAER